MIKKSDPGGKKWIPYAAVAVFIGIVLMVVLNDKVFAEPFLYGGLGIGAYDRGAGNPEIDTPNALGAVNLGLGYKFANDVDLKFGFEHWSSLQGFPAVFDSKDEDGRGFNAIWLKVEKRIYLK